MRPVLYSCAVLLAAAGLTWAQAAPPPAAPAPTSKPAVDLANGLIDPYIQAAERARFFAAAGVDNELDAKEFAADKARKDPFVRPFDRWEQMLPHDKDHNGTLDWFEADAYRQSIRQRVMKAYDADKDSHLKGGEREQANRMLAAGRLPGDEDPRGRGRDRSGRSGRGPGGDRRGRGGEDGRSRRSRWSGPQRGSPQASGEQLKAAREKALTRQYDRNRDGKLDEAEKAAMAKAQTEQAERMRRYRELAAQRRRDMLAKYDTDRNGKLDEKENAAMRARLRQEAEQRKAAWKTRREEMRKKADANGDGTTSKDEWRQYWQNVRKQYDANGDGKLDKAENEAMRKALWGAAPARVRTVAVNGRTPMIHARAADGATVLTTADGSALIVIKTPRQD